MEDMTFTVLNEQVKKTEVVVNYNKQFPTTDPLDLVLANQLAIMKALNHIDDDLKGIPR